MTGRREGPVATALLADRAARVRAAALSSLSKKTISAALRLAARRPDRSRRRGARRGARRRPRRSSRREARSCMRAGWPRSNRAFASERAGFHRLGALDAAAARRARPGASSWRRTRTTRTPSRARRRGGSSSRNTGPPPARFGRSRSRRGFRRRITRASPARRTSLSFEAEIATARGADPDGASRRGRAAHGRELSRARREAFLRRDGDSPRRAGLRRPDRRPARRRERRTWLRDPRRDQPGPVHARRRRDGALRSRHGRLAVVRRALSAAPPRRRLHRVRARSRGVGRPRPHRAGRPSRVRARDVPPAFSSGRRERVP